jgi:hypothetical protein
VRSGEKNAEKRKYAAEGNTAGPDPNVTGGPRDCSGKWSYAVADGKSSRFFSVRSSLRSFDKFLISWLGL